MSFGIFREYFVKFIKFYGVNVIGIFVLVRGNLKRIGFEILGGRVGGRSLVV